MTASFIFILLLVIAFCIFTSTFLVWFIKNKDKLYLYFLIVSFLCLIYMIHVLVNVVDYKTETFETTSCKVEQLEDQYEVTYKNKEIEIKDIKYVSSEIYNKDRYKIELTKSVKLSGQETYSCILYVPTEPIVLQE